MSDIKALGADLRRVAGGRVLVQGDDGFDDARTPWDLAVDQHVTAVVEAQDETDVAAVIGYAGKHQIAVATQAYGHAPAPFHHAILLRTSRLRGLDLRVHDRTARLQAGVQWGELLTAAGPHRLTGLAGSNGVVSATGFTLGGGLSWFGRKHGIAAHHVRAFDVVRADGSQARITADTDPDLFWALRGGGGDFAVVTAMEIDLHPAPHLYGGRLLWPAEQAEQVLSAFRATTAEAPDDLSLWFHLLHFPPLPDLPEPLRGRYAVTADVAYLGDPATGGKLLNRFEEIPGLILDTRAPMNIADLPTILNEPTQPTPGLLHGQLLPDLDDAATTTILTTATGPDGLAPLTQLEIRHLGGAFTRSSDRSTDGGGACGRIAEQYLLTTLGIFPVPELRQPIQARQDAAWRDLARHTSGRKPFTFLDPQEDPASAFPAPVLDRLRDIKRRHDPAGILRSNHPVL